MIADIVFDWNALTTTLVAWALCVSLALAADFGPEVYREKKARAQLIETVARMAERRQVAKPITFDPAATFQLGVFKIEKPPVTKRRHAKV